MTAIADPFATAVIDPFTNTIPADIELDESQCEAINKVSDWLSARLVDPKVQQVFRVGGHAGSGKTTIISEVIAHCARNGVDFELATISGKAAAVLRKKGLPAQTIHSIFFQPNPEAINKVSMIADQLRDRALDQGSVARLRQELKSWQEKQFVPRTSIDTDLIVIDESSMVDVRITNQLKSFGRPILAVGDPAQLPPVQQYAHGEPLFSDQTPDAMLTGKHRFGGSGLLNDTAEAARANQALPADVIKPLSAVDLTAYDIVLVWSNVARWKFIHAIRGARGLPLDRPAVGDKIVFWKNRQREGVFNGETVRVLRIEDAEGSWEIEAVAETGDVKVLFVDKRGFLNQDKLTEAYNKSNLVVASFGEVLTCHKGQGSEWPRVLVADHPGPKMKAVEQVAWRYTAVTRASETLTVADDRFSKPVKLPKGVKLK